MTAMDENQKHQILFSHLVLSLHSATMQQLGKLKNPFSDKIERDLPGAQSSIDMLAMIHAKTRGNLTAEEDRFISQILQELRLNYVDEVNKPAPKEEQPGAAQTEKTTP